MDFIFWYNHGLDVKRILTFTCIYTYCKAVVFLLLQGRGGEELSAELSVALRRCLLGGKSGSGAGIDLSSLVVVEGKICWDLYIDGLVVSSDGNLLDALGAAIKEKKLMFPKAALSDTGIYRHPKSKCCSWCIRR
ncbi:exosome complex exonuclease RRP42-like [Pyrus x bretschneideri]|uniref:exosome complex exonuclease RRP42-like n=1 Tax=Pyrus x bretschneideri TaxID=225117 RepID=UPI00202E02A7|nr:exosome complex exonuclease RRP42-like [Pyrus x bretschneideri]